MRVLDTIYRYNNEDISYKTTIFEYWTMCLYNMNLYIIDPDPKKFEFLRLGRAV